MSYFFWCKRKYCAYSDQANFSRHSVIQFWCSNARFWCFQWWAGVNMATLSSLVQRHKQRTEYSDTFLSEPKLTFSNLSYSSSSVGSDHPGQPSLPNEPWPCWWFGPLPTRNTPQTSNRNSAPVRQISILVRPRNCSQNGHLLPSIFQVPWWRNYQCYSLRLSVVNSSSSFKHTVCSIKPTLPQYSFTRLLDWRQKGCVL